MKSFIYIAATSCIALATMAYPGGAQAQPVTPEKPNIVFIISDDHRWDCLGLLQNSPLKTPNLDRMAREGQWYRETTIQIPTCTASRSAILTGLPPHTNGWYSNEFQRKDIINPHGFDQYDLLPDEMIKAGYRTAMVGKWHIAPDPWLCGFQTVHSWMVGGAGPYKDPSLANGKSRERKIVKGFTNRIFADDAIAELQKQAGDKTTQPLFMWLAFTAPHGPFIPNPPPYNTMYAGKTPEELAPETFYYDPQNTKRGKQTWENYYKAISALDAEIGRIMDTIRNSSLAENTLVVFLGDNGFMMGARGMHGKFVPYEASLRVPMIVWGPDEIVGATGTTVTASVNSLDLPPTFVKIAGGTPPADWTGRDVTAVFKDGQNHDITYAVSEYPDSEGLLEEIESYNVIRTPEFKLIHWRPESNRPPEFYDLKNDPGEKVNVFGKAEVAQAQARLEGLLADYVKRTDDAWEVKGPLGMHEPERLKWGAR